MSLVLWATTLGSVAGPLLAKTGDDVGRALGLPPFVGPFLLSGVVFALSTVLVGALLRVPRAGALASDAATSAPAATADDDDDGPLAPDEVADVTGAAPVAAEVPILDVADEAPAADVADKAPVAERVGAWRALRTAVRNPLSLVAVLAIVCAQTVMVGVMVMTPVHMTDHGLSLALVGVVISIHVVGMYGASPIVGWFVDRVGPVRVIAGGAVILFASALIGILAAGDDMVLVPVALGLLGLGWSCGLIGGSTLLTTSVDPAIRVPLQGATDAAMNVTAAASAALSGVILGVGGYAAVNVVAVLVLVPLIIVVVRLGLRRTSVPA
jgi:MFS family permease